MANFYDPYKSHPAWGQGISDFANQIMQYLMMKKYMGQGQGQGKSQMGQTAMPQQGATAQAGAQNFAQQAPGGIDPQMLAMLAKALGLGI